MLITEKHMTRGQARQDAFDEKEHRDINSQLNIKPGQVWSLFWPDNRSESGLKIRPVFILESSGSRATVAELTGSSARLIRNEDGKLIPMPGEIQLTPKISEDVGLRKKSCLRLTQRADVPIKCLIKRLGELKNADDLNYIIEEAKYLDNNKSDLLDIYRYSKNPYDKKDPLIKKVKDGIYRESVSENSGVRSNGIYSVMNDAWIKEPTKSDIPDIDIDAFNELFREWEDRYFSLLNEIGEKPCASSQINKDLLEMALNRNDAMNRCDVYVALRNANLLEGFALENFTGANISKSDKINKFIEDLYDLRKKSINDDGEYGLGNLIFKEMRNRGYLDRLRELKNKAKGDELSLEAM